MRRKTRRVGSVPERPRRPSAAAPKSSQVGGTPAPSERPERSAFLIVGVGASAGGLEAFSQFLRALPIRTGMAVVLVQHLDPKHESQLSELLSKSTAMPVITITDGLRVEPNHVYVIPPTADLTIGGGAFALTPRAGADRHMPIDQFMRSLAREQGRRAIGVVLSGTGSDGTLGLRAIKAEGGITFVQDERSAKHPGMPQSAAAVADFVLLPSGIARELARLGDHPYLNHADPSLAPAAREEVDINAVFRILRSATGVDFAQYKPASVGRRIARRMLLQRIDDLGAYVHHLRKTPREAQALHDDILIHVTGFFRDPDGFEALQRSVFPSLVKDRTPDEPIRVWVPGCATGEEAYSLAMCLQEYLEEKDSRVAIQMFATDLSAAAITRARAGTFPASIENEVSPDRLRRFFVKADGRYQISTAIRDACVFAQQDLTRDPPFSRLDLISCCNVLIYLGASLQERVIPVLHYALKPTGFLKLGPSESVGRFTNLFSLIDKKHKIYARKPGPSAHLGFGLTAGDRTAAQAAGGRRASPEAAADWSGAAIEKEADRLVLGRYAPAGVVVNAEMEIVQFRGKTGPYLEGMPGAASLNLFKMAREGLASALRQAVQQAAKGGGPAKMEGVRVKTNGGLREVSLEVIPIGPAEGAMGRHHLILFSEERPRPAEPALRKPAREREPRPKTAGERRVAQLTQELADLRQHLQAITEEHEAAMEELRAATEEAQSTNEELQSTNEELGTSKEELQATNEELTTVNDELNSRSLELRQLSDDLGNVLTSTHVPIVMVGTDLRIRRMTPVTERILNVAPGDMGRPIGDLRLSVEVPGLESLLRGAIDTLTAQEREVEGRDGRWYAVRVRPYRTADNRIEGAVISFVDIDALKRGLEQARAIVETVRDPLVVLDGDLRAMITNRAFYERFQVTPAETERRLLFDLGNRQWDIPELRRLLLDVLPQNDIVEDFQVEHNFETIGRRTMLLNARRLQSAIGPSLILLAIEDVTERTQVEAARAAARAKDEFLAMLSHELRGPLGALAGAARLLDDEGRSPGDAARARKVIGRQLDHLTHLVEDLLDVSRVTTARVRLSRRLIDLGQVVKNAVESLRTQGAMDRHTVTFDGQPVWIDADETRIEQIISNLVGNALKFTPPGGSIAIRVGHEASQAVLTVKDTGVGIPPEALPRIFDLFVQGERDLDRSQGGLGIGLTLVRHLVEAHGGTVDAASGGLGAGTVFTVRLPAVSAPASAEAEPVRAEAGPSLPRRVLIVEDNDDSREMLRLVLTHGGHEVHEAADGPSGVAAALSLKPDVALIDVGLPRLDGYEVARRIRAQAEGAQIYLIALTGYGRPEDRRRAQEAGFDEHLVKPVDPTRLAPLLARARRDV